MRVQDAYILRITNGIEKTLGRSLAKATDRGSDPSPIIGFPSDSRLVTRCVFGHPELYVPKKALRLSHCGRPHWNDTDLDVG